MKTLKIHATMIRSILTAQMPASRKVGILIDRSLPCAMTIVTAIAGLAILALTVAM
jgi:hypothetical protein